MTDIVGDVESQCEIAIEILNDLLHVEKIEGGTFTLEGGAIPAWSLISRTVKPFQLQVYPQYSLHHISHTSLNCSALCFFVYFSPAARG